MTAKLRLVRGQEDQALEDIDRVFQQLKESFFRIRLRANMVRGEILTELGEFERARRELSQAYTSMQKRRRLPHDHLDYAVANQLGILFTKWENPEVAATWNRRSRSMYGGRNEPSNNGLEK